MDAFALIEAMLERPARPHILSSLDVFDIARQALVETPSYDEHMRLEEQFQSADGCFTAFQIRDDAVRGSTGIHGVSFMLTDAECMSEVSLRIVTGRGAGVAPPSKDNGGWGVADALHDAGHVLTIAAGVLLIGLAVLAPFALFALLFWLGNRFRVRRLRERALG